MARWFDATQGSFSDAFRAFLDEPRGEVEDVAATVSAVLADVREKGGEAVARYTAKFDRLTLDPVTRRPESGDRFRCRADHRLS